MANQIVVSAGAKVRNLDGVLTGTSGVVNSLPINASNGIPQLDVNGKILVSQLPNSVMEYKGTWNAATNTPTLVNGTGNQGDVYLCNVAGTVDFGAGPIAFFVGDQVIYSGSIWQRASGATGTVTSVAITESGDSLNITGSPITTSGTINIGFNGTNLQYVNGAGNLTTFPTLITSIGLSMPSAFSVANSPLTANGTIAVTGAGYASQYIRGDGTLASFPTGGGGGSSVSYYLNGGTNQGTFVGNTYYEMSKSAVIGTGVDFTINANGYISQFITDANDPAQLVIPAGNWNFEMYFSASSGGGSPSFYVELYKYNGSTFTLIADNSANPEYITNGTAIDLYTTAVAVPETSLTITDRLAIRVYVTHASKTITLHTQNSHLCQVITTFSTGITALNGLTAQVQYFQTGTSGTDFNISSTTATHTFNIPDASATNRGLITTGTQTIAGAKTFSGGVTFTSSLTTTGNVTFSNSGFTLVLQPPTLSVNRTVTLPNGTGTLALTSDIPSITGLVPYTGATGTLNMGSNDIKSAGLQLKDGTSFTPTTGYTTLSSNASVSGILALTFDNSVGGASLQFTRNVFNTYNFPNASGTIALTSNIPSLANYVTLDGIQTITGGKTFTSDLSVAKIAIANSNTLYTTTGYTTLSASNVGSTSWIAYVWGNVGGGAAVLAFNNAAQYTYTFPAANGTLALTSSLSGYLPLTGGTLTGGLIGTTATFTGKTLIGTTTATNHQLTVFSATEAAQIRVAGNAPSVVFTNTITDPATYVSYFGMATATNNFISGSVAGDYIFHSYSGGNILFGISNSLKLKIATSGAATFSSSVQATNMSIGIAPQTDKLFVYNASGTNTGLTIQQDGTGDIVRFNGNSGANRFNITQAGAATFSSSVTATQGIFAAQNGNASDYNYLIFNNLESGYGDWNFYKSGSNDLGIGYGTSAGSSYTNAMTIKYGGNVIINGEGSGGQGTLTVRKDAGIPVSVANEAGSGTLIRFSGNGSGVLGSITHNGSNVAYNTSSDYRLKQDLKDYNGLELISTIKTYDYEWKSNKSRMYGVMAHELQEVLPYAVIGEKDEIDEDDKIVPQGVDYSKIVPILVKSIQELEARLKTIENK
jgi:hypothetical protein